MGCGLNTSRKETKMKQRLIEFWNRQSPGRKRLLPWAAVIGVVLAATLTFAAVRQSDPADPNRNSPTAEVRRGPLTINIVESGTIRPREQIVLRNELDDPATILFVAPEGKLVKKGELLVELDVTELANEVVERRILVQNAEADLVHSTENMKVVENQAEADIEQARLDFLFAKQDLEKYQKGEFPMLVKEAEAKITLAEEELSQAEEALKWSQVLFSEKYLSQSELQQDELAAKKTQLNLELARADLELLNTYTYRREIDQLESDVKQTGMALERAERMAAANIAQARAQLAASDAELKEETERLRREELQLSKAKIYAPIDGMVLYASSVTQRWRRDDEPIEVGTVIDERDEIIYLPTALDFDVDLKISEVDLNKVSAGLPVRITVDSMPDKVFHGKVSSIAQLPDSESRFLNPNLKLYRTVVQLAPNPAQLRNGMSCRAEVSVEHHTDTVFVPIQSVVRVNGRPAVYALDAAGKALPREVAIGLDNSRFVQIRGGLEAGEHILLTPPLGSSRSEERNEPPPATAASETAAPQAARSAESDRT
jgi:HlyD family secretion protein